jgi:hypothetical protein
MVDEVAQGEVFSEYFDFPCHFSFPKMLHSCHMSSGSSAIAHLRPKYESTLSHSNLRIMKYVELYLHSPMPFFGMVLNHRNNFTIVMDSAGLNPGLVTSTPTFWLSILLFKNIDLGYLRTGC